MQHIKVIATGKVQGVGYRAHARACAYQFEIQGYAKNMEDGTVELEAAGEADQLERWLDKINQYPNQETTLQVKDLDQNNDWVGFNIL
ncbi:acylphosphatase [Gammaproteobacteria bacterium]|nr:acylphosphatase [Gammaproteobacteria bacterium]